MKNINTPRLNQIRIERDRKIASLRAACDTCIAQLENQYNISEHFYNANESDWSQSERDFNRQAGLKQRFFSNRILFAEFEWFIKFLVVTNIARRKHLLHIDTMLKKIAKYGSDGEYAATVYADIPWNIMEQKFTNYGITIMHSRLYEEVLDKTIFGNIGATRYNRLCNFEKKFHISAGKRPKQPYRYKEPTKRHTFKRTKQWLAMRANNNEMPF